MRKISSILMVCVVLSGCVGASSSPSNQEVQKKLRELEEKVVRLEAFEQRVLEKLLFVREGR